MEYSVLDQAQDSYSDYFKSLYGFRPRGATQEQWNSLEWLDAQMMELDAAAPAIMAIEANMERDAIERFESTVSKTIEMGAKDRESAIRWLRDSTADDHVRFGSDDYFEHFFGLPYGYLKTMGK